MTPYVVNNDGDFYFKDGNLTWFRDFKGLDSKYLYYWLIAPQGKAQLQTAVIGSAQPAFTISALKNMSIELPSVFHQSKVVAILSAYDDLIENNTRRIEILEEMARSLYREWFVNFRFPGHEKSRVVDSPLGKIPEGWNVCNLGEISLNFDRFRKPLSSMERQHRKGIYPYYGAAKIFDYIDDYIFDGTYLLMAEDGSVITPDQHPVLQYATGRFWANNHTHILQGASPVSTEFLYFSLRDFNISGFITGAAQPKITQANLNRIQILVPDESLLGKFNNIALDFQNKVVLLQKKNEILGKTRDLLLSKLISGEIDVSKFTEENMEVTA
jgi:type I restriction enzyme, S subunit